MTAATAIDWNAWRASYDGLTFADQQAFYDRVYDEFPEQARYSTRVLERFLAFIDRQDPDVVELGGWDGGFAQEILWQKPLIASWTNYEISAAAVRASVCDDSRFFPVALRDWYWRRHHVCDLFVASHVLEHLKLVDVLKVFDTTHAKWLYLQSPIADEGRDWTNYRGSHILEVGWRVLVEKLEDRHFALVADISEPWARCFKKVA